MTDLGPGAVVAQRYRLERLLGEGGMGAVWAGVDVASGEHVALKFIKGLAAVSPLHHKRFYREARAAMAVKHPNVVRIHEVVRGDDGAPIMVMDLLAGESLAARLARERALPLPTVARLMLQVVSAVGTAHMVGIVHRDLKPDNIFLQRGTETEVRVLDFGIAKLTATEGEAAQTAGITSTGSLMGTPYYMAPEQVFGEKDLDHRADIWALGVVLYEALAGVRPIDGENVGQLFKKITRGEIAPLSSIAGHLPGDVTDLVARMLQVDRSQRPADLREVLEVLQRHTSLQTLDFGAATLPAHVSDMPSDLPAAFGATAAATVSAIESAPTVATDGALARSHATERPAPRSRALLAVLGGSAAALVGGAIYFTQMRTSPTPPPESHPAVAVDTAVATPPPAAASTAVTIESAPHPSTAAPSSSPARENKSPPLKPRPAPSASSSASAAVPSTVAKPTGVGGIGTAIPF